MDPNIVRLIEDVGAASRAGTRSFGEIVAGLAKAGVESYRVDYRQRTATYFMPSGENHTIDLDVPGVAIDGAFDAEAIVAAIRGSQAGAVKYPEFVERSMRAGCVGYIVWIEGRHVTYFGRRGEVHVERFPSASK
jgi:uncharacterized protein YbcV (DUF1398 family)